MSLFACSRCYSRHAFEDLSSGQQLCKGCRSSNPLVKCTYCRTEFQPSNTTANNTNASSSSATATTCKKCDQNIKQYGKPQSCVYCNIIAAFIGNKCQRCTNSEKKYGLPAHCEQCKMQCAWDRGDQGKKVDGKLLCWLCTLSYKRALARTKTTTSLAPTHHHLLKRKHHSHLSHPHDKRPHRPDVTKIESTAETSLSPQQQQSLKKDLKMGSKESAVELMDTPSNSDQLVALTQLREQIANLTRTVQQRDRELLAKDRQITELRACNFTTETELRNKLKAAERDYDQKVQTMTLKIKQLQKELAAQKKEKMSSAGNPKRQQSSLTIVGRSRGVFDEGDTNSNASNVSGVNGKGEAGIIIKDSGIGRGSPSGSSSHSSRGHGKGDSSGEDD